MTIAELGPEENNRLRELAEFRTSMGCSPIDEEANEFVAYLVDQTNDEDADSALIAKSIDFMGRLVGWSSRDMDESTGQIRIATLDRTNVDDTNLDKVGIAFFEKSDSVVTEQLIQDDQIVTKYSFHQLRVSGKVREVTVHRKEPIGQSEDDTIVYCLSYTDVGQYGPQSETLLDAGAAYLKMLAQGGVALAGAGIDAPRKVINSTRDKLASMFSSESEC